MNTALAYNVAGPSPGRTETEWGDEAGVGNYDHGSTTANPYTGGGNDDGPDGPMIYRYRVTINLTELNNDETNVRVSASGEVEQDGKILSTGGVHEPEFFQKFFAGMNQGLFLDQHQPTKTNYIKLLALLLVVGSNLKIDDEDIFGVILISIAVSLGFATIENIIYVINGGFSVAIFRGLFTIPLHASCGAILVICMSVYNKKFSKCSKRDKKFFNPCSKN